MTPEVFQIGEVRCDLSKAIVYEHGWQSWSPSGLHPVVSRPPRARRAHWQTMCYRPARAPEPGLFQGEGLLALAPGDGTIHLWGADDPRAFVPSITAQVVDDRVVVSTDGPTGEIVHPTQDLWVALGAWAEDLALPMGVGTLAPIPPVWCSWYCYWEKVAESDIVANLEAIDRLGLDVSVVQIDDGHEAEIGDWLERSPRFGPLSDLAGRISDTGRRTGIWTAPFLVGSHSRLAHDHPEWLVRGVSAGHHWGQELVALDVTHPGAADHVRRVFRTLREDGIDYFKIDFLYAGALDGHRHGDASGIDAYREGLRLIREGAGTDATILGCGAPILPSIGLVDAMRISPDVGPLYEPAEGDLSQPSVRSALVTGRGRAWQHGRWWINDPDCLIVRPEIERREEWANHVEASGGLVASSDPLDALDAWGLETTRRLLRPSTTTPPTRQEGFNALEREELEPSTKEEP